MKSESQELMLVGQKGPGGESTQNLNYRKSKHFWNM